MSIAKIMNKGVHTVYPDKSLFEIQQLMDNKGISHVIVMENRVLIGIISDRDIKRYRSVQAGTSSSTASDEATLRFKAHQIMSRNPIIIKDSSEISEAISIFLDKRIHFLPVVDERGDLVGSISPNDLLRILATMIDLFH